MKARNLMIYLMSLALVLMLGGLAHSDINSGLRAHFEFENNIVDSTNNAQGVDYGEITYESGVVGDYAARFDGNAVIYFPTYYLPSLNQGTISLFAKVDSDLGYSPLTHYKLNYMTAMIYVPDLYEYPIIGCNYTRVPVQPEEWTMVTFVYDSPNLKMYLNGELYDEATNIANNGYYDGCPSNNYKSTIGIHVCDQIDDPTYKYRGLIDDLRFYDRLLTPAEVEELFLLSSIANIEKIKDLIDEVFDLNLKQGISNSLDAKLNSALQALDDANENNDVAACNSLQAVINAVEAQSGKSISVEEAQALISAGQDIMANLGCT